MNESQLFANALNRTDPADRAAYLDSACAGDPELRAVVEALLQARDSDPAFLEQPAGTVDLLAPGSPTATLNAPGPETPGTVLAGRYKLLEPVGEGGMGTVWLAQQTDPVRRPVAVKLIKPGMDSRQVLARFEAERQALALMDHPNIAKVFDAGATPDGRPFFVMELVQGVPITTYCDRHQLTPRERLELFVPVCQALQHAHTKAVIHRDVKPSNVLVARCDGRPVPKVIDFGVAKAAGMPLTGQTAHTGLGAVVGTPEYMSPEQATFSQLDIDTRSDVYALGALLYELLAGSPPFSWTDLEKVGVLDLLRVIREVEPDRPSTRLSTADTLPALAANRRTEPGKLIRLVRGELDWIVMKALEKDRSRRYETASALAADVRRYLADEPVLACPPSAAYRVRKFVRRNKGPVLAASLVVVALTAGVVGTTIGLVRAERRAEGEQRAKDTAEKRLAQIERGIDMLGSLFDNLDPWAEEKEGRPLRAILGDRLDLAAAELDGEAVGDPLVVAKLQERLGRTYLGLGQARRAEALFAKAVATREALLGADDPLTLVSRHNQAVALMAAGKQAEALHRFEQVWDDRVRTLGADHLDTLTTQHELGSTYWRGRRDVRAIALLEQVRDGRVKQLGEDHDSTLVTLQALALVYSTAQRHSEAIALAEQVRDARVRKHGPDHPHAVAAMTHLANIYQGGFKMKEAVALFDRALESIVPKLGPNHPLTLRILSGQAHMHLAYGRTARAIPLCEQVRAKQLVILGEHHPTTLYTTYLLANAYLDADDLGRALPLCQEAAIGVEKLEYVHDYAPWIVDNLAQCHERLHQYDRAEVWRRKWVAAARQMHGPESLLYAGVEGQMGLGSNLVQQKKYADAEPVLRASLAVLEKHESEAWDRYRTQALLGAALLGQRKYTEAESPLVAGYRGLKMLEERAAGSHANIYDTPRMVGILERLVELSLALGRPDEAARYRKELDSLPRPAELPVKSKDK